MDASGDMRLRSLFDAAVARPEEDRAAFLEAECGNDAELLERVLRLLAVDAELVGGTVRAVATGLTSLLASWATTDTLTGMRVGPYVLREELGRGGMGAVYRADRDDGTVTQRVAIKFVRPELLDAQTRRRFQLERQVLASLDHPYIARLFDTAELADGTPYFVMEFVAGMPVTDFCEHAGMGVRARIALMRRVCDAVAHAHRAPVVHRDLKPGNILVSSDGTPKLLDFGIAKMLPSAADFSVVEQTGTAERFFSPLYAAPEQLLGRPIGVACDVYALGLLLYELLAGARPFDFAELSPGQVERLVAEVPPLAPSAMAARNPAGATRARELRGDLDGIVLRCLRKLPGERYSSVEQLDADLANYLEGRPVQARGGHGLYRLRKFVGRHRLPVAIGAAASVALVVAAIALVLQNWAVTRERDRAQYALDVLKDAFTSADPARTAGAEMTARQILEAARPRIEATFETQPELYATLAGTLAEVQFAIGEVGPAAELVERAIRAANIAAMDAQSLGPLLLLSAKAQASAGKLDEAEARLADARRMGMAVTPEWQLANARLLCLRARCAESIPLLQRAIAQVAARPPTDELATTLRWQLAEAWRKGEDFPRALAMLSEILAWQRRGLPVGHPRIALTRLRRVDLLGRSNRQQEALAEAQAVAGEVTRHYGPATTLTAFARGSLGGAYHALGMKEEALREFRIGREAYRLALGELHPRTLRATYNLAITLKKLPGREVEAEEYFRKAIEGATSRLDPKDELLVFFRLQFAEFLLKSRRPTEALVILAVPEGLPGIQAAHEENREPYFQALAQARAGADCDAKEVSTVAALDAQTAVTAACAISAAWLDPTP